MIHFSVHMYLPHPTPKNFQYILYTNKHHKLRHSKCGREKFASGHRQNDGKTRRSFRSYNRAFKIALINTDSIIAPSVVAVVKPPMT